MIDWLWRAMGPVVHRIHWFVEVYVGIACDAQRTRGRPVPFAAHFVHAIESEREGIVSPTYMQ